MSERTAVLKLTELQQSVFCAWDNTICYPVPGKWGQRGWTILQLDKADTDFARDMLKTSYCNVAPKKLAELYTDEQPRRLLKVLRSAPKAYW